ncbi:MAG TPA: trypsin-like peptidase domain-containing protein [Coleofasciculaceae cyanobacterium]
MKKPGKLQTLLAAAVFGLSACTSAIKPPSALGQVQEMPVSMRNLLANECVGQPEIPQGAQSAAFLKFQQALQELTGAYPTIGLERIPRAIQWLSPSVPLIEMEFAQPDSPAKIGSLGAGIVVDERHIVTNKHVAETPKGLKLDKISVTFYQPNGRILTLPGRVKALSDKFDLAVLEVDVPEGVKLQPAAFRMNDIVKGLPVVAIGNPQGFANSATAGIISLVDQVFENMKNYTDVPLIMTDTAINPGNSGGALADTCGAVIGMPSFILKGMQNMNFAIPSKVIVDFLRQQKLNPDVRIVHDPVLNPLENVADGKVSQPKTVKFA